MCRIRRRSTALKRQDASITLTSGLNFGPGLNASNTGNAGNEFNVAGFSTVASQQSALTGDDYLTFSVQPIAGMAMIPDSVSFTLWRQSMTSATGYALFSTVAGFTSGQQIAQANMNPSTFGSANKLTLEGTFLSPQPTTDPIEFRLYGWGAGSAIGQHAHHGCFDAMRGLLRSSARPSIRQAASPCKATSIIRPAARSRSTWAVTRPESITTRSTSWEKSNLAGNLSVLLADAGGGPFAPASGDVFQILSATQGVTGQFANVALPTLPWDLNWSVNYLSNAVTLSVTDHGRFQS